MKRIDQTRFWIVRHAPVIGRKGVIHGSDAECDVSDLGRLNRISAQLPEAAVSLSSPATRTIQTAVALKLQCVLEPGLREQDFGDWTGRDHLEISRADPNYSAFWADAGRNVPPGGESFQSQISRTRAVLGQIDAEDAILVAHSGTVRAALAIALEVPPARALSFVVDPLSLTRVDRVGGAWRICFVNRVV